MQTFFVSHNLFCYFVVHMSESDDNDNQSESETEIRINNISEINQKNLINVIMIKYEWADTKKKHQQKLKLIDKKL